MSHLRSSHFLLLGTLLTSVTPAYSTDRNTSRSLGPTTPSAINSGPTAIALLFDRTGSMTATRQATGRTICQDAQIQALQQIDQWAATLGGMGVIKVFTFAEAIGAQPITAGYVNFATARQAVQALSPTNCPGSMTALAKSACQAIDDLRANFPSTDYEKILYVTTDGGQNDQQADQCTGPSSTSTNEPFDLGSWQNRVYLKARNGLRVVNLVSLWQPISAAPAESVAEVPQVPNAPNSLPDSVFFQRLANATGGQSVTIPSEAPIPQPVEVPLHKSSFERVGTLRLLQEFVSVTTVNGPPGAGGVCSLSPTLSAAGWYAKSNSNPFGAICVFQGNPAVFSASSGLPNEYAAINWANSTGSTGVIATWLVSPVINFGQNSTLEFRTRTFPGSQFGDRLQVWYTSSTAPTPNVGTFPAETGEFTTLLLDINPGQARGSLNCASGITDPAGRTVPNYPHEWCRFRLTQQSGMPASGFGRIAFKYYVTNSDLNADYIGIDDVSVVSIP